jgi:hypothetical protein
VPGRRRRLPAVPALIETAVPDLRHRTDCLLDLAVYAPIGLAVTVGDRLPDQLRQGARLVGDRVKVARAFGEMVVRFGRAEIEREVRAQRTEREAPTAEVPVPEPPATEAPAAAAAVQHDLPPASALPIGDYESLAAIHVVQRLPSLRDDEIDLVERFERAHRARRTILAKIEQLREARTP